MTPRTDGSAVGALGCDAGDARPLGSLATNGHDMQPMSRRDMTERDASEGSWVAAETTINLGEGVEFDRATRPRPD